MATLSKERAEHLCSILRAAASGKVIQYSYDNEWFDISGSIPFNLLQGNSYRIKPEPRKTYYRLWENLEGFVCIVTSGNSDGKRGWEEYAENKQGFYRWIGDWQEHIVQEG